MGLGFGRLTLGPHMGGGFAGLGLGSLMFLSFLAAVAVLVWLLYRSSKRTPQALPAVATASRPVDAAVAILRERLARGEIDSTEYERLTTILARVT